MTEVQKQLEKAALDAAYQAQIGLLFTVLCNSAGADDGAVMRFRTGLLQTRILYGIATSTLGDMECKPD